MSKQASPSLSLTPSPALAPPSSAPRVCAPCPAGMPRADPGSGLHHRRVPLRTNKVGTPCFDHSPQPSAPTLGSQRGHFASVIDLINPRAIQPACTHYIERNLVLAQSPQLMTVRGPGSGNQMARVGWWQGRWLHPNQLVCICDSSSGLGLLARPEPPLCAFPLRNASSASANISPLLTQPVQGREALPCGMWKPRSSTV